MLKYPRHLPVDIKKYSPTTNNPEAYYGLPQSVLYCHSCVISNQRPNSAVEFEHTRDSKKATIHFDADGVCDACRLAEEKQRTIDWEERERAAARAVRPAIASNDGSYDCIVPGSGGKDSFYAAHVLKYQYGMHPLTVTWAPHIYTDWGWENFQAWIHAGLRQLPAARRTAACIGCSRGSRWRTSSIRSSRSSSARRTSRRRWRCRTTSRWCSTARTRRSTATRIGDTDDAQARLALLQLRSDSARSISAAFRLPISINEFGVHAVRPSSLPARPIPRSSRAKQVEVHYLGYYLKWHPQSCYYYAVEHGGFQASPERTPGTYSKYNCIDDRIDDFHYYTTFIKFGIGRATYDAAQEIRSRRHHARRRRRAGEALRRRVAGALRGGDLSTI